MILRRLEFDLFYGLVCLEYYICIFFVSFIFLVVLSLIGVFYKLWIILKNVIVIYRVL